MRIHNTFIQVCLSGKMIMNGGVFYVQFFSDVGIAERMVTHLLYQPGAQLKYGFLRIVGFWNHGANLINYLLISKSFLYFLFMD